jgi:hypothetical protein
MFLAPRNPPPRKVDLDRLLAAARVAPKLELIEWDGDQEPTRIAPQAKASVMPDDNDPRSYESRRRKILDRYVGTRFPGVVKCASDLEAVERVIKAARLYFEEDRADAGLELLELAIAECPRDASLWLARLEILYLVRDAAGFTETACAFRNAHATHDAWTEVTRLGRALAPHEALFGVRRGPRDHEHYGPWPHTPNWIQAPWDLTADVAACDFHRAMRKAS